MNMQHTASARRAGKAWVWIVAGLAVVAGGGVALWLILSNRISSDFDLVPRDAQLFVTVRVADTLESEPIKKLMTIIMKEAGGKGLEPLQQLNEWQEKLGLKLTDIERITFVVTDMEEQVGWLLVHTRKDIDKDKVLAAMNGPEEAEHEGKTYHRMKSIAFHLVNARLAVVAPEPGMKACLDVARKGPGSGPLKDALKLASKDRYHIVAGANMKAVLRGDARKELEEVAENEDGPEGEAAGAVLKLESVTYTIRLDKKLEIEAVGEFENRAAAKSFAAAVEKLLDQVRGEMRKFGEEEPAFKPLIAVLEELEPKQSGSTVTMRMEADLDAWVSALVAAVQKVREAAARTQAQSIFHVILTEMFNYESERGHLPGSAIRDQGGKPLLSWRVEMLPYIEQRALYEEFRRNEPWDSEHNKKLIDRMPKLYDVPHMPPAKPGHTYIQVFTGADTVFPKDRKVRMAELAATDGASNTILLATAAKAVPWTAPDDIVIDQGPIKSKLHFERWGIIVGYADGSVRSHRESNTEKTWRALINPRDGEVVNPDE